MKIDVKKIAKLSNLEIKPEEEFKLEKQLIDILQYVEKLNKIDTKEIPPTSQVTGLKDITRNDEPAPSLTQDEALSGTDSKHNGLFKVEAILGND